MTKNPFGLVFFGPWTNMDWSYVVQFQSINIWISPGPVLVLVAPFGHKKPDLIGP